ncbi:peptidylprolyl isomerase [bacterium SCSIO 12741]|nr:peptidylprolyl isomerase [bacterium SCSIO 12741]
MRIYLSILLALFSTGAFAQPGNEKVIDGIVAVIGENMILKSDVEEQFAAYLNSGKAVDGNTRCELFEDLLFNKLLLNQAETDSLYPSEGQIDDEINRRLRYFINQFGSQKKLEEFYEKSVDEIRIEFHDPIKEQLMIQRMQGQISGAVEVSPGDVRSFFEDVMMDSLPNINAQVELAQIVKKPPIDEAERTRVRNKLLELRERVLAGEDFGTLAYLYSEDPGSARENGVLGPMGRAELVPEFAAVAFTLEKGETSGIVETEFGYHLIQMVERVGTKVNARHILLIPKVQPEDLIEAKQFLDTLKGNIAKYDSLSFTTAAILYSDDKDTKNSGGLILNPMTGSSKFEMDQVSQIDPSLYLMLDRMEEGDVAGPELAQMRDGSRAYRLVKLVDIVEAHEANLKQDYQYIQELATQYKQNEVMNSWIEKRVNSFYIRVDDSYSTCQFRFNWLPKTISATEETPEPEEAPAPKTEGKE